MAITLSSQTGTRLTDSQLDENFIDLDSRISSITDEATQTGGLNLLGNQVLMFDPETNILEISGGNKIDLSYFDNSDEQLLVLQDNKLTITNGNTVDLSALVINSTGSESTLTLPDITRTVISSFDAATNRSAEYTVTTSNSLGYNVSKILVIHNNNIAYIDVYGSAGNDTGIFSAMMVDGNVELSFTAGEGAGQTTAEIRSSVASNIEAPGPVVNSIDFPLDLQIDTLSFIVELPTGTGMMDMALGINTATF